MNDLTLTLTDGTRIVVPNSLQSITSYVLLEQEAWFEKESAFLLLWLQNGMNVIDIGANAGVYSLPIARRIGPDGKIYAYEPASEPRSLLEKSRALNHADNLIIEAAALSDRPRDGQLVHGTSSELNSLSGIGAGESVRITSLDEEDRVRNWRPPDFVKIDAEGEEQRILEGGRNFFARYSPLVMFEIKNAGRTDHSIGAEFLDMGYGLYRLVPGGPLLVPVSTEGPLDEYELNLFAAKPDRAAAIAHDGFLVEHVPDWEPDADAHEAALGLLKSQRFSPLLTQLYAQPLDRDFRDAMAGYATWRSAGVAAAPRYAALLVAFRKLDTLCQTAATVARLSSLARIAWELGERMSCVKALELLLNSGRSSLSVNEVFWPANPRFDHIAPDADPGLWFFVAAVEQFERARAFSSKFSAPGSHLEWLCRQNFVSPEMERRLVLNGLRTGINVPLPQRLGVAAPDHLNSDIWRSGTIPHILPAGT